MQWGKVRIFINMKMQVIYIFHKELTMVKAIKYENGNRFYCLLDLSQCYYLHNYFAPMEDEPLKMGFDIDKWKAKL